MNFSLILSNQLVPILSIWQEHSVSNLSAQISKVKSDQMVNYVRGFFVRIQPMEVVSKNLVRLQIEFLHKMNQIRDRPGLMIEGSPPFF
jgi:hypothetical protein